jgi:AraC family transcriptional regulator of adaptative response / DNA-3-methyladenine glycosylase II
MNQIHGFDIRALDRARISRDPRFDGKFFIAVTSTRIYCRPVCPVRSPKRSNIRYYPTAAAAAEAGYRPCLRCRPEAAPGTPAWLGSSAVARRALRLIDEGALDRDSVDALANRLGIGSRHLHRLFVRHVGASPITVAQTRRLHFAKRLLDDTNLPITEIALAAGFGSLRRFNSTFQQTYGRAPRELRKRTAANSSSQRGEVVLKLAYRPPYDWSQVRQFFALRAIPGVERVDDRGYARTVRGESGPVVICIRPVEGEDALELRVQGAASRSLFHLSSTARRVFDLASDPARIVLAFRTDALLGPFIKRSPGVRIPGIWDPFEGCVRAVLEQHVKVAAAQGQLARLVARVTQPVATGEGELTCLFPTPQELVDADLDGLDLTDDCIITLRALAQAVNNGALAFDRSGEEIQAAFEALPGVGIWAAEYLALRVLNEPDAFPASDVVLRNAAGAGKKLLPVKQLEAMAETWRPWRGYAAMHLWHTPCADVNRS